jgi:hypothetical protein
VDASWKAILLCLDRTPTHQDYYLHVLKFESNLGSIHLDEFKNYRYDFPVSSIVGSAAGCFWRYLRFCARSAPDRYRDR